MPIRIYHALCFLLLGLTMHSVSLAKMPQQISAAFNQQAIIENKITLDIPDIAENGAVVPVGIKEIKLPGGDAYVTEVFIFAQNREQAIASFKLSKLARATNIKTRIRLAKTTTVYAVARLSDGSIISGHKPVKVTIGGCGGGGDISYYQGGGYRAAVATHSYVQNTERYASFKNNGVVRCSEQPLSTFSIDVDTGSYSSVRRFILQEGRLPLADAVRVEEMINYFSYDYPSPVDKNVPFSVITEVGPNPWNKNNHLLHIGLKGYTETKANLPPANLVFLIDVSGSMHAANKLGLLKTAMKMLTWQLREQDSVSIVVYAGSTGVVLPPTSGSERQTILAAFDQLRAGGSTNGAAGIQLAYSMARQAFKQDGINRVLLATDGDFNVGVVDHNHLIDLIKKQRQDGISLTTLGFGAGNYNEKLMEQLADHGNGNYAYIDNVSEAKKVLVEQISGTLFTIAKDVKIQVEFNPAVVAEYRLIGYENRLLRTEDFRNDKVDAGDIGAGHTVTALYEISFTDSAAQRIPALRYSQATATRRSNANTDEIAAVQLRYKLPDQDVGLETQRIIQRKDIIQQIASTSENYRFSAAVAAMGQWLRGGEMLNNMPLSHMKQLAQDARRDGDNQYRNEFISMLEIAENLR